jgi:hypothetical protein
MSVELGLGRFGDRRLQKGGLPCIRPWLNDRAPVSVAWVEGGRARFSSRGSCGTRL